MLPFIKVKTIYSLYDLKDFFPSVEQSRVWKRLQLKPFNFSKQMANIIAGLCSMRQVKDVIDETKEHNNDKKFKYVLPQGSPVSPIITNMICDTLDRRLAGLARRFGLHYSRYLVQCIMCMPLMVNFVQNCVA